MTTEELKQAELLVRVLETNRIMTECIFEDMIITELCSVLISDTVKERFNKSVSLSEDTKSTENTSDKFVDSLDDTHHYNHFLITRTDNKGCVQTFTEKLHTEKSMYLKYLHNDKDIKGLRGFNSVR